jgi:cytochrome b subunit of formate dehydrogenase
MTYVERYGRAARRFHAVVYLMVLTQLTTGWWFVVGRYRRPLLGLPDRTIHELNGLVLLAAAAVYVAVKSHSTLAFIRESLEYDRGDARWFARWPAATVTGRFPHHEGRYDPGQRLANLIMAGTLTASVTTGSAMVLLPLAPPISVAIAEIHRWSAFTLTPVIIGHVIVASGVLPGYRGAWRSMHLGGRLPEDVALRIWPGATRRDPALTSPRPAPPGSRTGTRNAQDEN